MEGKIGKKNNVFSSLPSFSLFFVFLSFLCFLIFIGSFDENYSS